MARDGPKDTNVTPVFPRYYSPGLPKNLDLIIQDEEANLIGLGTSRSLDDEVVLLSSEFDKTVTINVVNTAPVPVDFEISIHTIRW